MGQQAPQQQQQAQVPGRGPTGPMPPVAPPQNKFQSYMSDNRGDIGAALFAMGTNMLAQGPSENPMTFGSMLGQGAQAGGKAFTASKAKTRKEEEEDRIRKRQEILQRQQAKTFQNQQTTFANNQQTFANTQADRTTQEAKRLKLEGLVADMDMSTLPPALGQVIQLAVTNGDYGAAVQAVSQYRMQQMKDAATLAKGPDLADNPALAGGAEMDTAAVIANNRFMAENGRLPGPNDAMVMARFQTEAFNDLKSQIKPAAFETEQSKLLAKRNDDVQKDLMTKANTRNGMRDYHRTALSAVDNGLETGPLAGSINKLYGMGEQGVRMAFGDDVADNMRVKANEQGVYPDSYEAFRAGADAAAIKVTQDLSGQISNFELALSRGTNITEDMLPSTIKKMAGYKELQYQHDDARDAAYFEAANKAAAEGVPFRGQAFLHGWDRDNALKVEDADGNLTKYGQDLYDLGIIKPKEPTGPTTELPNDYQVVG